ncbi:MAG: relaxase/mobilization nuclease domain-containing protein [Christensenella sp.]
MATVNFIPCSKQCVSSMKNEIEYILQDFKVCIEREKQDTDHTINYQTYTPDGDKSNCIRLISGKDCCPETAFREFMATKSSYKKADQTMFYHYDQAFKDGETISPKTAHEIAVKFAEDNYPDFEVVIATHVDNEHLHSHFIINSVSFKTGKKLHEGPNTLLKLRQYSDQICQQYGLTTLEPYLGGKSQSLGSREYRAAAKGKSWKFALMVAIDDCMKHAPTKKAFALLMERKGYAVKWTDTRKNITYTCPNNKSCRDILLHNPRYLKEKMECEFELRRTQTEKRQLTARENATGTYTPTIELLSAADRELGGDATANQPPTTATPQPQGTERGDTSQAEPTAKQDGFTGDTASGQGDGVDIITGWEAEREILFHPQIALAESADQPCMAVTVSNIGGIVGGVVQLGKALERLDYPVPIKDATAKPAVKEHKKGVGQKEDDHSGYDFEMTM